MHRRMDAYRLSVERKAPRVAMSRSAHTLRAFDRREICRVVIDGMIVA